MKEMKKIVFAVYLNEISKIGIGANHKRYQKSPYNPFEVYQHNPENMIQATINIPFLTF